MNPTPAGDWSHQCAGHPCGAAVHRPLGPPPATLAGRGADAAQPGAVSRSRVARLLSLQMCASGLGHRFGDGCLFWARPAVHSAPPCCSPYFQCRLPRALCWRLASTASQRCRKAMLWQPSSSYACSLPVGLECLCRLQLRGQRQVALGMCVVRWECAALWVHTLLCTMCCNNTDLATHCAAIAAPACRVCLVVGAHCVAAGLRNPDAGHAYQRHERRWALLRVVWAPARRGCHSAWQCMGEPPASLSAGCPLHASWR